MRPVETIPGIEGIKESDGGGEFMDITMYLHPAQQKIF
jgi:hypothetical protein